jgi:hypothetical protein
MLCSRQLATCSYPGQNYSRPRPPILFRPVADPFYYDPPIHTLVFKSSLSFRLPHQNHAHISLVSRICHVPRLSYFLCFSLPLISWRVQILKPFIMQFSSPPAFPHFRPKHLSQHRILVHSRPFSFLWHEKWSLTPLRSDRQKYVSVSFNICMLGWRTGRQEVPI